MSESRKNNEELTVSPQGVSHQELTTVAMDAASSEGEGGGGRLETPGNRESPEEANGEEEEDNEGGDDDEEEEEEEEEGEDDDDEEEEDEEEEESDQSKPKECVYKGCTETTSQVAKTRKPWMCKKHRNKTYKDKYKKKKKKESVQAMVNINKSDDDTDERPTKQRLSCMIVHQTSRKASLLEQVLNQKRLSLLRSPEVVQFLQQQQRLLSSQALAQRQQFQETPM